MQKQTTEIPTPLAPIGEPAESAPGAGRSARGAGRLGGPVLPSRSVLRPLGTAEIAITGGFWAEKQELNARVILAHCEKWMERVGWTANFDRAADGTVAESHAGIEFVDSEVYKLLEGMAWELGRMPDPALERRYHALVARVAAAQEPDGYLHTSFGRPGQPARFSNLEWGHELYCFGHLIQAAVARLRTGHDDALPAVARRLADHVWDVFGPGGRVAVCGHPEIEPALAELARATGEPRYLELARLFVERRGTGTLGPIAYGAEYFQDDTPVRDATVLRGHAVRALYLSAGAVDVAVETDDAELRAAVEAQWEATVARRTYVTGGMGSHHLDEAFGTDFELPPDRAYAETCAGIASNMLSWRLLLQSGDPRYAELIERTLLNTVLVSPREDGRAFYYTNTLQQREEGVEPDEFEVTDRALSSLRAPWFWVSCCPTNVARTLASVQLSFATASETGVQLHQYGSYAIDTVLGDGRRVQLDVRSGYPFDGEVTVEVGGETAVEFALTLRVPSWARGAATLRDRGVPVAVDGDTVTIERRFTPGETVVLSLPMEPRVTRPHPRIDAVRGQVAIERGPLVLCVESPDLPHGLDTEHVEIDLSVPPRASANGAVVTLRGRADDQPASLLPYGDPVPAPRTAPFEAALVPYFSWANRGPSTMRVWIPA
ncbi:hypothetical protein HNR17_002780 [Galbitalea soli]|nr:hypothetical protein [Galbitalea soli]